MYFGFVTTTINSVKATNEGHSFEVIYIESKIKLRAALFFFLFFFYSFAPAVCFSMHFGAIQICGERIGTSECSEFCEALDTHKIKMLSLRECSLSSKNFKRLMDSVSYCKSLLHLNLNLSGVKCQSRVENLAAGLNMNKSITALL